MSGLGAGQACLEKREVEWDWEGRHGRELALESKGKQGKKIPKSVSLCRVKTSEQKDLMCTPNHLPTSICVVSAEATLAF